MIDFKGFAWLFWEIQAERYFVQCNNEPKIFIHSLRIIAITNIDGGCEFSQSLSFALSILKSAMVKQLNKNFLIEQIF